MQGPLQLAAVAHVEGRAGAGVLSFYAAYDSLNQYLPGQHSGKT